MPIKKALLISALAAATLSPLVAQETAVTPVAQSLDKLSDAEFSAWVQSLLDRGLPDELGDLTAVATHERPAIIVTLTERKIEQVLASPSPAACFSDGSVSPQEFVKKATAVIRGAGDENALRAVSRLMHIDEPRFSFMVGLILYHAQSYSNAFTVAYRGLALGDTAVGRRIAEWTETQLGQNVKSTQQAWAEAMLDRYGVIPNAEQWRSDPIASRLSPKVLNLVRENVTRAAVETLEKRTKR
jgi:hypothetical protein